MISTLFPNLSTPLWCDIPFTEAEENARIIYDTVGEGAELIRRVMNECQLLRSTKMIHFKNTIASPDASPDASVASSVASVTSVRSSSIILHNIPRDSTEDELRFEFECYGRIQRISIPTDNNPKSTHYGGIRGFAIIQYKTAEEAESALQLENNRLVIRGKAIRIEFTHK